MPAKRPAKGPAKGPERPTRATPPAEAPRGVAAFGASASGIAAVEFALVAGPFFMIVCAILQFAYIVWAAANLDHTVQQAVRALMTGSFQNENSGVTDTKTLLANLRNGMCGTGTGAISTVFKCANVKLNVSTSASFAGGASATAYDASTKAMSTSFESYTCAQPGTIVVLTAAVSMPTFFGKLVPGAWTLGDGSYLLQSTQVFRTEPYQPTTSTAC